jgi:hypothetical protein
MQRGSNRIRDPEDQIASAAKIALASIRFARILNASKGDLSVRVSDQMVGVLVTPSPVQDRRGFRKK